MKNKISFIAVPFQNDEESMVIHYLLSVGILISIVYRYDGDLKNVLIRDDANKGKLL